MAVNEMDPHLRFVEDDEVLELPILVSHEVPSWHLPQHTAHERHHFQVNLPAICPLMGGILLPALDRAEDHRDRLKHWSSHCGA